MSPTSFTIAEYHGGVFLPGHVREAAQDEPGVQKQVHRGGCVPCILPANPVTVCSNLQLAETK